MTGALRDVQVYGPGLVATGRVLELHARRNPPLPHDALDARHVRGVGLVRVHACKVRQLGSFVAAGRATLYHQRVCVAPEKLAVVLRGAGEGSSVEGRFIRVVAGGNGNQF